MISIPCNHPDLEEFIDIKQNNDRVTKANISIRITNEFMNAVKNKQNFELSFVRKETGEEIKKVVDAYEIFRKICESNWDWGEPGMLFWDTVSNYNLLSEDDSFEYGGVNPCVPGNTEILTDKGYIPIEKMCDREVNIWNGYEYSKVIPHITGYDQKICKLDFSDGSTLRCTPYHKFILNNGCRVEAKNLRRGDKLIKCSFPVIEGYEEISEIDAYTMGFFMGDGCIEKKRGRKSIKLYGEKRKLIQYIDHTHSTYCPSFDGEYLTLKNSDKYNKDLVVDYPYTIQSRLDWLAGYIDSDGTIQSTDGGISISSVNRNVLMAVKRMLNTLGCNCKVRLMYEESDKEMPTNIGDGGVSTYHCRESYRLLISAFNVGKLVELGLKTHRVEITANPNRDASRFITVCDISDDGICDTVYCFNEPKNHSGIFNGVITSQCAEEPLPPAGSCNLGSINLAEFVKDKKFDFESFKETVSIAVQALNDVLDEGMPLHPLQEQRDSVRNWRQIGLGIFGLADMLIKMGIRYGDKSSLALCDTIGQTMASEAIIISCELAIGEGPYPNYRDDCVGKSEFFINHTDEDDREYILFHGLRNSQLLTIPPCGTIATMLQVSGGIEPIFANHYTRKTESLHGHDEYYKIYTPIVWDYMQEHNLDDDEDLPEFFVTAQTLDYNERIAMQAVWQKHIDASISSTVNLPNSATVEDVEEIYLEAWRKGLKGVTIFRDGCKRVGILTLENENASDDTQDRDGYDSTAIPRGVIIRADDNCIGRKRTLHTGCGTLHCEAFFDPDSGELLETYLSKGSAGGCQNYMVGLSRMMSLAARGGVNIYSIVDQLKSAGTCPSYAVRAATRHDTSVGSSCPVAIGNALLSMYKELHNELFDSEDTEPEEEKLRPVSKEENKNYIPTAKCPQCGGTLVFEGGCNTCKDCGWSKCD